jgi:hypothetical protein
MPLFFLSVYHLIGFLYCCGMPGKVIQGSENGVRKHCRKRTVALYEDLRDGQTTSNRQAAQYYASRDERYFPYSVLLTLFSYALQASPKANARNASGHPSGYLEH